VSVDCIAEHGEVVKSIAPFVKENLGFLKPVEECWQPSDFLPALDAEDWQDKVNVLRAQSQSVPDGLLVVLVGNTVTEEALPAYQTMVNRHPGVEDETGTSDDGWALWTRGWTAEENRHGDILSYYLYLSGRVDMHAFEVTTQHLIRNGFNPKTGNDPYQGLIYTSFQERSTKVSHGNTALLANKSGDELLGKICALVTGDEARHEEAYKLFVSKLLEVDPNGALIAFSNMMKRMVTMPASLMDDGVVPDLFDRFSAVAQELDVYTAHDYADNIEHLIDYWKVASLSGLNAEGAKAQEHLMGLTQRYRKLADRVKSGPSEDRTFSWIFNRVA